MILYFHRSRGPARFQKRCMWKEKVIHSYLMIFAPQLHRHRHIQHIRSTLSQDSNYSLVNQLLHSFYITIREPLRHNQTISHSKKFIPLTKCHLQPKTPPPQLTKPQTPLQPTPQTIRRYRHRRNQRLN